MRDLLPIAMNVLKIYVFIVMKNLIIITIKDIMKIL